MQRSRNFPQAQPRIIIPAVVLTLSVAAHGLVLFAPMPQASDPKPAAATQDNRPAETESLSVVVLPSDEEDTAAIANVASSETDLQATPPALSRPATPPQPLLRTNVTPQRPVARELTETLPPEEPAIVAQDITAAETTEQNELTQTSKDDDQSLPEEAAAAAEYGELVNSTLQGPVLSYADTFPHFEGAVEGCFGLGGCRRVSNPGSYRTVARSLIADLEGQGYRVDLRDDLEDTGRNVYELIPPDSPDHVQYLMVFSDMDGSAVYVLSNQVMTLNDLQALQHDPDVAEQSG